MGFDSSTLTKHTNFTDTTNKASPLLHLYAYLHSYNEYTHPVWSYLAPTIVAHASYMALLASAYVYGDVGLVYPLARGTAILLASIVSQVLHIDVPLNWVEILGIGIVLMGILGLSYDALMKGGTPSVYKYEKVEGNGNVEMTSTARPTGAAAVVPTNKSLPSTVSTSAGGTRGSVTAVPIDETDDGVLVSDPEAEARRKKLLISIGLAVAVGMCTASYSILDSRGVKLVHPLVWSFWLNLFASSILFPYLMMYHGPKLELTLKDQKRYIFMMAPATTGAYIIILYVFELPDISIAIVVTLREFSVLVGAVLGVVILKENCGIRKFAAIVTICIGMATLKFGSTLST
jgi:drug/metabolite transporter (DMT)-like permease